VTVQGYRRVAVVRGLCLAAAAIFLIGAVVSPIIDLDGNPLTDDSTPAVLALLPVPAVDPAAASEPVVTVEAQPSSEEQNARRFRIRPTRPLEGCWRWIRRAVPSRGP
jgi:hypothetical protein